jgi:hypothetical protein
MARATPTHSKPLGKRDGIRAAPRVFSAVELLNLWEPTGAWEEYRGLAYGEGPREKLDVYRPRRATKAPLLVFFYGGSWQRGSRDLYSFVGASSLRSCRIIRSSHRRGFLSLSKTPRERCALPVTTPRSGAAIPRGSCSWDIRLALISQRCCRSIRNGCGRSTSTRRPISQAAKIGRGNHTKIAKVTNKTVVAQAQEFVWGTDDSQLEFVRRYMGTAPERVVLTEQQRAEAIAAVQGQASTAKIEVHGSANESG